MLVSSSVKRLILSLTSRFEVYAIEATVHAPSWEGVYSEIKKVLKPGGIVSFVRLPTIVLS